MRHLIRGRCSICRGLAVLGTVGAFLFTIALSDAPRFHERIHNVLGPEHECAVTLVASGSYHHATPAPLVDVHVAVSQFSKIPALTPQWVESPFLGACIFEHAPPAHS
jgi:hypothetical protein